jgi:hypothetical protein
LSSQERSSALERLLNSGLDARTIAARTGKPANVIWSWLRVARSPALMNAMNDGRLGIHEARVLSSLPDATITTLLPELDGQPQQFRLARIQRELDDSRTSPPARGFYKATVESRTRRLLTLILEQMRGVRDIRTSDELDLVREVCAIAGRWQRDLQRSSTAPP